MADLKREIKFPNDYDKSKIDPRSKKRSDAIRDWRIARLGGDIRAAMADGVDIASINSIEAKNQSANAQNIAQDTQKQFNAQIHGQNKDSESKDARVSSADNKTYDTLRDRLNAMDKKPQQAVDDLRFEDTNLILNSDFFISSGNISKSGNADNPFAKDASELSGQDVTLALRIDTDKVTSAEGNARVYINLTCYQNDTKLKTFSSLKKFKVGDSYHGYITNTFTIPEGTNRFGSYNVSIDGVSGSNLQVGRPKLQLGSKFTGWSPALEDSHHHQAFRHSTRFFAHRGAQSIAPENSLPAIRKVANHAGVEIDIHCTSDGWWVVMHDGRVDRTTNGQGAISSFSYNDIRKLKLKNTAPTETFSDAELLIPTLNEALVECKDKRLIPVIEIKVDSTDDYTSDNYDYLAEVIKRFGVEDEAMFISFNYGALQEIKKRLPNVEVSYLTNNITANLITQAQALGVNAGIDSNYNGSGVNFNMIEKAHKAGLKVGVWTTKDDSNRTQLLSTGVDFITTNSLSGELKFINKAGELKGGWKGAVNGMEYNNGNYVTEIAPGVIELTFSIHAGKRAHNTIIFELPKWASPRYDFWRPCIVRTKDGDGYHMGSFDIVSTAHGTPPHIRVGLGWDKGKTDGDSWVSGQAIYHI